MTKRTLSVFLGLSLLFSFNHSYTLQTKYLPALQTKYLPWITSIAAIIGGIVGYNWKNDKQWVGSRHNAVIRWLFKKINAEQNPQRAVILYRALRALLGATISGGATYGIAYLFTPWGLKWLAGIYAGTKLYEPIAKGAEPINLHDVVKAFPGAIHRKHPYRKMSSKLSWLGNGLLSAQELYQKAAHNADLNDSQEQGLATSCIEQAKKLEPAINNVRTAQYLIKESSAYYDEMCNIREEERNRIEWDRTWAEHRKADAQHEQARAAGKQAQAMHERNKLKR